MARPAVAGNKMQGKKNEAVAWLKTKRSPQNQVGGKALTRVNLNVVDTAGAISAEGKGALTSLYLLTNSHVG